MYGPGVVIEIRSSTSLIVQPSTWLLANNKPPVFYLNSESVISESDYNTAKTEAAQPITTEPNNSTPSTPAETTEPPKKKGCIIS